MSFLRNSMSVPGPRSPALRYAPCRAKILRSYRPCSCYDNAVRWCWEPSNAIGVSLWKFYIQCYVAGWVVRIIFVENYFCEKIIINFD